jgi:hypothetical protein
LLLEENFIARARFGWRMHFHMAQWQPQADEVCRQETNRTLKPSAARP